MTRTRRWHRLRSTNPEDRDYPMTTYWVPATNSRRRDPTTINSVVIHTTQGPSVDESGCVNKMLSTDASIHYIVNREGVITQMVRDDHVAFHTGGRLGYYANLNSIGIEHVNPRGQAVTEATYAASARLVRWLCAVYGVPVVLESRARVPGIKSHQTVSSRNKPCPGDDWNWDHYMKLCKA